MKKLKIRAWGVSIEAVDIPAWIVALGLLMLAAWGAAKVTGWL